MRELGVGEGEVSQYREEIFVVTGTPLVITLVRSPDLESRMNVTHSLSRIFRQSM